MIFIIILQSYLWITKDKDVRHSMTNMQVFWFMSYILFDLHVQEVLVL